MDRADKNKVGTAEIEDLRVIPVIFLPGIMGTNLKENSERRMQKLYGDTIVKPLAGLDTSFIRTKREKTATSS
jgi:hypothetical protein